MFLGKVPKQACCVQPVCPFDVTERNARASLGRTVQEILGNDDATVTKTSPENISFFHLCCFAIISTRSTFTKMANYPGTKLVGLVYKLRKKNEKFNVVRSRSPQNLKCGHFTLLFCRGRQRNVPKYKTHVQSHCFCSLNLLFCGVVVVVAVVVA